MRNIIAIMVSLLILQTATVLSAEPDSRLPRLKVSPDQRMLVTESGRPFFWLVDTAWELFHRLNRDDADRYLENRAKLGFTVVQAVALAEIGGLTVPNPYGHTPLHDNDPTQPNEDYFRHVDWIVKRANEQGIYVGFLPTWGDKWHYEPGVKTGIFTPENAELYGRWLGERYKDAGLVWILGGDRRIENERHRKVIAAMARGLRKGDGGSHLITFHPSGSRSSSEWFHQADWLDFNLIQSGHCATMKDAVSLLKRDYAKQPPKPSIDGEPRYEDIKKCFYKPNPGGRFTAKDVREIAYRQVFFGAFGHTYGHNSIWQMYDGTNGRCSPSSTTWQQALNAPGGAQMQYVKKLLLSRPLLGRVPAPELIQNGTGAATKGNGYCYIYLPAGEKVVVNVTSVLGPKLKTWWYNPQDGTTTFIGEIVNAGQREFIPPQLSKKRDWILVLDDAGKRYPSPGTTAK